MTDLLVGGGMTDLFVGGGMADLLVGGGMADLLVGGGMADLLVVPAEAGIQLYNEPPLAARYYTGFLLPQERRAWPQVTIGNIR